MKLKIEPGRSPECKTRNIITAKGEYIAFNVNKDWAREMVAAINKTGRPK